MTWQSNLTWPRPLPGRPVEPDPGLVRPRRVPGAIIEVAGDDRTVTVGFARAVYERLHAVEVVYRGEEIEITAVLGITPELAAEMAVKPMAFTMQAILQYTVVTLAEPVRGRRCVTIDEPEVRGQPHGT